MVSRRRNRGLGLKEFRQLDLVVLKCPGCTGDHCIDYPMVIITSHYRPLTGSTIWMIRLACPKEPSVILFDVVNKDRAMYLALAGAQTPYDADAEELAITLSVSELSQELESQEFIDWLSKEKES